MAPTAELGSCHRHLFDFDVIVVVLEKTYVLAETNPDDCLHGEERKIQCMEVAMRRLITKVVQIRAAFREKVVLYVGAFLQFEL